MFTDPPRMRKKDPGRPELCNVFTFHGIYSDKNDISEIDSACRKAEIGCTECKGRLAKIIKTAMREIHEKQEYYREHIDEVMEIISKGNERASSVARQTMQEVRESVKI
jgi:tryptophanyl-tRNA synthetase